MEASKVQVEQKELTKQTAISLCKEHLACLPADIELAYDKGLLYKLYITFCAHSHMRTSSGGYVQPFGRACLAMSRRNYDFLRHRRKPEDQRTPQSLKEMFEGWPANRFLVMCAGFHFIKLVLNVNSRQHLNIV